MNLRRTGESAARSTGRITSPFGQRRDLLQEGVLEELAIDGGRAGLLGLTMTHVRRRGGAAARDTVAQSAQQRQQQSQDDRDAGAHRPASEVGGRLDEEDSPVSLERAERRVVVEGGVSPAVPTM